MKVRTVVERCIGIVLMFLFTGSAGLLGKRIYDDQQILRADRVLQEEIGADDSADRNAGRAVSQTVGQDPMQFTEQEHELATPEDTKKEDHVSRYKTLLEQNPDFIGWLRIDGTKIDLPVVYRKADNEFYLSHGFDGRTSVYGVPFIDMKCNPDPRSGCNNFIIYGHHMKTGMVFAGLSKYKDERYYREHPKITFNTIYEDGTYEIVAAFAIDVSADRSFQYYNNTAMDKNAFQTFVSEALRRSVIRTGIVPEYGDRLISLSTCEYSSRDGRFVVIARKVVE